MTSADLDRLLEYLPTLSKAAGFTITLAVASLGVATLAAVLLAVGLRSAPAPVRWVLVSYVQVGRAVPELVQVFIWFFVLPDFGIVLSPAIAGIAALAFAFAPYLGEVFRAGIDAVEESQWEAAEILGMSPWAKWTRCVLPQALRTVLPVWTGYFISIFKATSLLSFITVPELFSVARNLASLNFRYLELFALVMVFYLAMGYPTVWLLHRLEKSWDVSIPVPVGQ